jgi:hypothetical protein
MADESDDVDRDSSGNGQLHNPLTLLIVMHAGPFDVLLGRGRGTQQHEGNQRFQAMINANKDLYNSFQSRDEKTSTTREIVQLIKTSGDEIGRFLKFDSATRGWVEVDDEVARVKVAQALRYSREDDADTKVSARKTRSEQQQNALTSSTTTELSAADPSRTAAELSSDPAFAAPPLDSDEDPLLSEGAILSYLGYAEGSAFEDEMGDQTEDKDC